MTSHAEYVGAPEQVSETGGASVRIGLSGWSYRDWHGPFYPPGTRAADELAFTAGIFDTVEVNRTFYSLVAPHVYRTWARTVPDDFVFAVKGSRYITHMKKLKEPHVPLANFFASGVLELGNKLGPILWQLPGRWRFHPDRIGEFLGLLPRTTAEASELATAHDERITEPAIPTGSDCLVRHALELRDPSAMGPEAAELAHAHGIALAFSHACAWPSSQELTTDFAYLRLHGPDKLYASGYSDAQLEEWAGRISTWQKGGRDVFVYFDNDSGAHAPADARTLLSLLAD